MTISLTKVTDYCANCGAACAPTPSLDIDPLCTACKAITIPALSLDDFTVTLDLANFFGDPRPFFNDMR